MFKFGISLLFVIFAEIIFYIVAMQALNRGLSGLVVIIFIIEFSIAGWLINTGYLEEFKKKDEES